MSTNDDFVGDDASCDRCAFADKYVGTMDVPVNFAFDLHLTARSELLRVVAMGRVTDEPV